MLSLSVGAVSLVSLTDVIFRRLIELGPYTLTLKFSLLYLSKFDVSFFVSTAGYLVSLGSSVSTLLFIGSNVLSNLDYFARSLSLALNSIGMFNVTLLLTFSKSSLYSDYFGHSCS